MEQHIQGYDYIVVEHKVGVNLLEFTKLPSGFIVATGGRNQMVRPLSTEHIFYLEERRLPYQVWDEIKIKTIFNPPKKSLLDEIREFKETEAIKYKKTHDEMILMIKEKIKESIGKNPLADDFFIEYGGGLKRDMIDKVAPFLIKEGFLIDTNWPRVVGTEHYAFRLRLPPISEQK
jgi:hypothetical protein